MEKTYEHTAPSIPIKLSIPAQETVTYAIGLKFSAPFGNQITPYISAANSALSSPSFGSWSSITCLFLLLSAGFFVAHSLHKSKYLVASFATYALASAVVLYINDKVYFEQDYLNEYMLLFATSLTGISFIFMTNISAKRNLLLSLFAASLIVAATFIALLPIAMIDNYDIYMHFITLAVASIIAVFKPASSKKENISQNKHKIFFKIANITIITTATLSILGYIFPSTPLSFLQNSFILSLVPQMVLLIIAIHGETNALIKTQQDNVARKNRSVYGLARLQQSKDAVDQARLLRVIERERELMDDLRTQEASRAQEMKRAKEAADHANAAKSAFLAVVSHEIRTPMNGIMGILKLLQQTSPNKEQSDYLLTMQKSGDTMVALLNDILDFEKIENGSMELENINIDLHTMIRGILTLMSGYIKNKNVKLTSDISQSVPRYVIGDPTRLQQVLFNLISNALKFTEEGSVTVKLEKAAVASPDPDIHSIIFSIQDTGIGIPKDAQKTLFEPFKQADTSTSRKYGGTGLGLAICLRLIENMGSTITVDSTPGQGTCFAFTLDMAEATAKTPKPIHNKAETKLASTKTTAIIRRRQRKLKNQFHR